jgi:hypothetical protein
MSWPEAIFYSVLAICGAAAFAVLIFAVILSAEAQPSRMRGIRQDAPSIQDDLPRYVSIKYDGPEGNAPDMTEMLREMKSGTSGNPYDGIALADAARKAAERNERYRKAKGGEA